MVLPLYVTSKGVEALAGLEMEVSPTRVSAAVENIAISFFDVANSFEIRPNTITPSWLSRSASRDNPKPRTIKSLGALGCGKLAFGLAATGNYPLDRANQQEPDKEITGKQVKT